MKCRIIAAIILLLMGTLCFSTYSRNYLEHIFFDRLPSARTEAMGKILSVDRGNNLLSQSNPALLADSQGISLSYANSAPYYYYDRNYFESHFAEIIYDMGKYGVAAVNMLHIDWGKRTIYVTSPYTRYNMSQNILTAIYANKINSFLNAGININYYFSDLYICYADRKDFLSYSLSESGYEESSLFFDVGLSVNQQTIDTETLTGNILIGSYIKNILQSDITAQGLEPTDPSIWRIGASHQLIYNRPDYIDIPHLLGLELAVEYQNPLNYDYRTGWKYGTELSMLDILFLRAGYYKVSLADRAYFKEHTSSTTYGAGIKIDLRRFKQDFIPLTISLDYSSLPQPEFRVFDEPERDNFENLSVNIRYVMY